MNNSSGGRGASTPDGRTEELIAKLESAAEGSKLLDLALFRVIGAPLPDAFGPVKLTLTWQDDGTATMPVGDMQVRYTPAAYTTSVDAILALIERELPGPRATFTDMLPPSGQRERRCVATLMVKNPPEPFSGGADTPALALCIAFLKARSADQPRAPQEGRPGRVMNPDPALARKEP